MKALIGCGHKLARAGLLALLIAPVRILPAVASSEAGDEAVPSDASAEAALAQPAPPAPSAYRISPGDVLSITVWGAEEFSRECEVNAAGTISYPVLGDVSATGLTCSEFQDRLRERLREIIKEPEVTVTVSEYGTAGRTVFVVGAVVNPGRYAVDSGVSLVVALTAAGGPTDSAGDTVTITKARTGKMHTIGLERALGAPLTTPETVVEPGDTVVVWPASRERDRRYSVMGEVPSPGMYDIPRGTRVTILDAMEKAGLLRWTQGSGSPGTLVSVQERVPTADLEKASLRHGEVVVPLNLLALLQGDMTQNMLLEAGDVLEVPPRSAISVNAQGALATRGRQLLPAGSRVLDMLDAAGGVTSDANLADAKIVRDLDGQLTSIPVDLGALLSGADSEQNRVLQDGDRLFVPTREQRSNDFWRWVPIILYLLP